MEPAKRIFIRSIPQSPEHPVLLRGWVQRFRVLGKTTFLILKDCSGQTQCVAAVVRKNYIRAGLCIALILG